MVRQFLPKRDEPVLFLLNGEPHITSLNLAAAAQHRHANVLRSLGIVRDNYPEWEPHIHARGRFHRGKLQTYFVFPLTALPTVFNHMHSTPRYNKWDLYREYQACLDDPERCRTFEGEDTVPEPSGIISQPTAAPLRRQPEPEVPAKAGRAAKGPTALPNPPEVYPGLLQARPEPEPAEAAAALLAELRAAGMEATIEDGALCIWGEESALTEAQRQRLIQHKAEIVALLRQPEPEPEPEPAEEEPEPLDRPIVRVRDGQTYATSLDVAAYFRKAHKNVLQAIESLNCSVEFNRLNFQPVTYIGGNGEARPAYEMTRDGFAFLVLGFTGEEAGRFKEAYVLEFTRMERELREQAQQPAFKIPKTYAEALAEAARLAEELEQAQEERQRLEGQLEEAKPALHLYDRLERADGLVLLSDFAKSIHVPKDEMFDQLWRRGYIYKRRPRSPWRAYECHVKAGLFDHKYWTQTMDDGTTKERVQVYLTDKGAKQFTLMFKPGRQGAEGQGDLPLH